MNATLERKETRGYDPRLDYLTSADYGDGNPDQTPTWGYDAAGNRSDSVVDSLNRATSVGGQACTNDVLGNRLARGARSYGWDCLNRLTVIYDTTPSFEVKGTYAYRADGMRVEKETSQVVGRYRYDGQTPVEDVETPDGGFAVTTRYGLGARGVVLMERSGKTGTVTGFPVYDAHGNNVATLSRSSAGGYALADRRTYDAWGVVRSQQSGGDPKLRYCASLGHMQDDESGLVYMRARYYEPTSGRFISEDPDRSGQNWFSYCNSDPVNKQDSTGKYAISGDVTVWGLTLVLGGAFAVFGLSAALAKNFPAALALVTYSAACFAASFSQTDYPSSIKLGALVSGLAAAGIRMLASLVRALGGADAARGFGMAALAATTTYSICLIGLLFWDQPDEASGGNSTDHD